MCIIIYKKAGVDLKQEWIDNSAESNPHGFGFCFVDEKTKKLTVHRTLEFKDFLLLYEEALQCNPNADMLLHFRKNTCGETILDNCHPFIVSEGLVMMHNGTIKPLDHTNKWEKRSDTRIFAEDWLANMPFEWEKNKACAALVANFVGESKVVTMDKNGNVEIINEKKGSWEEGLWVSNWSYYPKTKSLQKNKPLSWDSNLKTTQKINILVEECDFYRWDTGKKYKWDANFHSWRPCDSLTHQFKYGEKLIQGTSPEFAFNNYRETHATYKFTVIGKSSQRRLPFENATAKQQKLHAKGVGVGECDWCGKCWEKDNLKVVACQGRDGVQDISLMCRGCVADYTHVDGLCGFETLANYDIDTIIQQQVRGDFSY